MRHSRIFWLLMFRAFFLCSQCLFRALFFASLFQIDLDIIFEGVLHFTKVELLTGAAFKDVEDVQTGRLKVAGGIIGLADEHIVASTVIQRLKRVRYLNHSIFSIFYMDKKLFHFIIRFPSQLLFPSLKKFTIQGKTNIKISRVSFYKAMFIISY